jgi:endonuclease/exonuclease/phosphatase family metal-dependent hydrolase
MVGGRREPLGVVNFMGVNRIRGVASLWVGLMTGVVMGCGPGSSETPPDTAAPEPAPLVLDGFFTDWGDHQTGVSDPGGDGAENGLDLGEVRIANDADYFYVYVELGKEVSLDEEPNFVLYLDLDADAGTGIKVEEVGAELVWDLGKRKGEHWFQGQRTTVYFPDLTFRVAPTVEASVFEMAFARAATPYLDEPLFLGDTVDVVLRDTSQADGDRAPDEGALRFVFQEDATELPDVDWGRSDRTLVRLMSYNVERPGFEQSSALDEFERVFQAVNPDIILLQEQDNSGLARTLISEWLPVDGGSWAMDAMTDKVTLSRLPLLDDWPADRGNLDDRVLASAVSLENGEQLALFNVHLTCCEDEVSRQREADSFIAFLREDRERSSPSLGDSTPFVFAGDLNLVSTPSPLNTLLNGEIVYSAFGANHAPDWDGSSLADVLPHHSHQPMTYTWRSDSSSYWPGRLDFVLYSDSVVQVEKAFVVDTTSLPQSVLDNMGLNENDTARASDHLPVVVDFFMP